MGSGIQRSLDTDTPLPGREDREETTLRSAPADGAALTYYGRDTAIDGIVLDVLLPKHRVIRNSTGVSVPVPADAEAVVEAVLEGLLLRRDADAGLDYLLLFELELRPWQ